MRNFSFILALFLGSSCWLTAQVTVDVMLDQEQFLRDESLPIKVRITNRSGQTLPIGKEVDELTFSVESRDGLIVSKLAEIPLEGTVSLDSSMQVTRRVDLMPCYDLSKPGRYTVTVSLKLKQWDKEFFSKPKTFEIVGGSKIWEQEFGVPAVAGDPEVRKYVLQQANYHKRPMLYVRVSDVNDNRVFKVLAAGPLVSFGRPEAQVDKWSNLHLLFQTGARSFVYDVITPQGDITVRQTHDYTSTRPVLKGNEDGKIFAAGGQRRFSADDVPPPSAVVSTNDLKNAKP